MNIFEQEKLKKAQEFGRECFKLGKKRIPCLDKKLEDMVRGESKQKIRMNLYKSWLRGWDEGLKLSLIEGI